MELNRKTVDELLGLDDNALREKAEKVARAAGMSGNLPDVSKSAPCSPASVMRISDVSFPCSEKSARNR